MAIISFDQVEELITNYPIGDFQHIGPLHHPIKNVSLIRDEELNLKLINSVEPLAESSSHKDGKIYYDDDKVEFTLSPVPSTQINVKLNGVYFRSLKHKSNKDPVGEYYVNEANLKFKENSKPAFCIEWLSNVDDKYWNYTDTTKTITNETRDTIIGHTETFSLQDTTSNDGTSLNTVEFIAKGIKVALVAYGKFKPNYHIPKAGYLIYEGVPTKEQREAIRECLSFAMGRRIYILGYTTYDKNWEHIECSAQSASSDIEVAIKHVTVPPSPLIKKEQYRQSIDGNTLSFFISKILDKYEELELDYFFWLYWHAELSPLHIQGSQFGATFEYLQFAYEKSEPQKYSSRILSKSLAKKLRAAMTKQLNNLELQEAEKKLLIQKINNINTAPQKTKNAEFLASLKIFPNEEVIEAWSRRNDSAHGNKTDDYKQLSHDLQAIKVLIHQSILSITNASQYYFDYTSGYDVIKKLNLNKSELITSCAQ